jgi:opacity protein-like surface antigen
MKKLLFLFMIFLFVSAAHSQEFKFMGGIAFSKPDQIMQPAITEFRLNAASKAGFLAGGGVELSLTKNIAFEIDGLYFQKGCKIKFYELGQFLSYLNYELNELTFPVLLKISIFQGTSPYMLGGGEFAFVLSHKADGHDLAQETKKTDYGLVLGVGFRKKIEKVFIFIEGRYQIGLQDLSRGEGYYLPFKKITSFVLMSGFSF